MMNKLLLDVEEQLRKDLLDLKYDLHNSEGILASLDYDKNRDLWDSRYTIIRYTEEKIFYIENLLKKFFNNN